VVLAPLALLVVLKLIGRRLAVLTKAARRSRLGWANVEIVGDDLGRSGGGITRPAFEPLLAAICEGRVGAVFAIEASRLARNGCDWHTLIEFCRRFNSAHILGTHVPVKEPSIASRHDSCGVEHRPPG
jgi:hypothetical protein